MGEQVNLLQAGRIRDHADRLLQVLRGELARLAIDVVSEQDGLAAARGPAEDGTNEFAAEEVAQLAHVEPGVCERIGVTMHEQHNLFTRRNGEPALDLRLESALCRIVSRDDGWRPRDPSEVRAIS